MQGVGRKHKTTCLYLNSPITLGNPRTCSVPFLPVWRGKMQLHPVRPSNSPPGTEKLQPENSYQPHQNVCWALISEFLSNSFHDNPLVTWQRGRGIVGKQNVLNRKSIKVSCDLSETLQMLDTRQNSIYFFFAFSLHLSCPWWKEFTKGWGVSCNYSFENFSPSILQWPSITNWCK